jgi:hypothetical protein
VLKMLKTTNKCETPSYEIMYVEPACINLGASSQGLLNLLRKGIWQSCMPNFCWMGAGNMKRDPE